jgi:hypothetical protein
MFEALHEGFVSRREPGSPTAIAAGPRCVLTTGGDLLCTFIVQSTLGCNDFVPLLSRSSDGGLSWSDPSPLFPNLAGRMSLFGAIGHGRSRDLFIYGIRTPIDKQGESFWSDATQGMKQNDLFWSRSTDEGLTWSAPAGIPLHGNGSAEAPCPLLVTSTGRWIGCYSPYNTFSADIAVDRPRVVIACSDDQGLTWWHRDALRFPEPESGGAEAWVVELADGRLLATAWHIDHAGQAQYPNAYALSLDYGATWSPTRSTGILGQSTALTPLPDGRALFIYNRRKGGAPGICIAVVNPTTDDFGVQSDEAVWLAPAATQHQSSGDHSEWIDFAFGEPSVVLLPDGNLLLVFWCADAAGAGVRFLKLRPQSQFISAA